VDDEVEVVLYGESETQQKLKEGEIRLS
jgi:hypothetical protein